MQHPLVSVLIPCYNAARWLPQTLDSVLAQTWPHREIIVVDDGSTDHSREILRHYAPLGITVICQPNAGQSAAFNRGLSAARGDYIEFLDADDLLAPDKIERQLALVDGLPDNCLIAAKWTRFVDDPASVTFKPDALWCDELAPIDWLVTCWTDNLMMHGAAWLVPTAVLRRAGPWREDLTLINDFEFFSRLLLHTSRVRFCAAASTYYRSALANSVSGLKSPQAWASAFRAVELGSARLLAAEDSPRTRAACAAAYRYTYFDAYPSVPSLRAHAARRIRELGHSLGRPRGGPAFEALSRLIGWKLARTLQGIVYRQGYQRWRARRQLEAPSQR